MRFLKYINEEFLGYLEGYNRSVELFINPDRKEMQEATSNGNSARFIGFNKDLYLWDSYGLLHADVAQEIKIGHKYKEYGFFGEAKYSRGKLTILWIDFSNHFPKQDLVKFQRYYNEQLEPYYNQFFT